MPTAERTSNFEHEPKASIIRRFNPLIINPSSLASWPKSTVVKAFVHWWFDPNSAMYCENTTTLLSLADSCLFRVSSNLNDPKRLPGTNGKGHPHMTRVNYCGYNYYKYAEIRYVVLIKI